MQTGPELTAATPQLGHYGIDRTQFGITAARGLAGRYLDVTVEIQCTRS